LFKKLKIKSLKYKARELPKVATLDTHLPALTSGTQNQGLSCFVPKENATILKNVISIAANGAAGTTFYQSHEFTILQDAYAIKWKYSKKKLSDKHYLFLASAITKVTVDSGKYGWDYKANWTKVENEKILLPITAKGEIDYKFMEEFIAELQAYLLATGLNDYELTKEEQNSLHLFNNCDRGGVNEFKLGDLFEIEKTLSFNKEMLTLGGEYDYVTRTSQNQGILQTTGFVNDENINSAGNWSLGLLQMDFFYRHKSWYAGQFMRKITPKIVVDKQTALFFSVILNKQKHRLLQVLVRDVDKVFKNTKIQLPVTANGEIDYEFMQTFIKAIQKLVIKDVVLYADRELKALRAVIKNQAF